ncbi:MAG: hypothetical protein AABY00_04035 [Nanoarchaeota archaeon]
MLSDLLKEIVTSVAGEKARAIVDLLYQKKNVNEFIVAKKLKLTINQTRNILYKLADEGLVGFIRKKDTKKGGWYTYFWTLNVERGLAKFKERLQQGIEFARQQIQIKKTARFFFCPNCHIEMGEEQVLSIQYTCQECGQTLELKDNSKEVQVLEKEIVKQEKVLQEVDTELHIITAYDAKLKIRKLKAEELKKKKEREVRKKQKSSAKKLLMRSKGKKESPRKQKRRAR